jgi:hypothetical protein
MATESVETRALVKKLLKYGFYFIKTHQDQYSVKGVPDILGCMGGWFVGIEVKIRRTRNRVDYTEHQKLHLENIRRAGGIAVGIIYNTRAIGPSDKWGLDLNTTGEISHIKEWHSLAGIAEIVRNLPVTAGLTDVVPPTCQRVGQTSKTLLSSEDR